LRRQSVEMALLSELSGMGDSNQLQLIEAELGPMYAALPKNENGRLDPVAVRYALHRYFLHKHGWYINGLGPVNNTEDAPATTTIMKDRAPSFIQGMFEQRLQGQGLSRHDLAVFAATLTDLIHKEVSGSLEGVYGALELPTVGPVTEKDYDLATKSYLIAYLSGGSEVVGKIGDLPAVESSFRDDFLAWDDTLLWAADLKLSADFVQRHSLSPFVQQHRSFDKHVPFMQEFGHRLGSYQNLECHKLKNQLVEMEDEGTGRVPLSRFYRGGLNGDWTFAENVDFLRSMGVLDETNPKRMSVVIPNWIQSPSNCFAGSSFYSVCCFDECEGLLGHVEEEVKGPSALPSQIAAVVSNLHSETVHAPRNISRVLLSRLEQIAELHHGKVPLHGRLFAQWMHHAYPRECPFPRKISAADLAASKDVVPEATEEEMALLVHVVDSESLTAEAMMEALPWTMAEELVAGHKANVSGAASTSKALRFVLAASVLVSMVVQLTRSSAFGGGSVLMKDDKGIRHLV